MRNKILCYLLALLLILEGIYVSPSDVYASELYVLHEDEKCRIEYQITSKWDSGFTVNLIVTNIGYSKITDWEVEVSIEGKIENLWNALYEEKDGNYTISSCEWNKNIQNGEKVNVGFTVNCDNNAGAVKLINSKLECEEENSFVYTTEKYDVEYKVDTSWDNESQVKVVISNKSDETIHNWGIRYITNDTFNNVYNANEISDGDLHILKNSGWNQDIPAKGKVEFGYSQKYDKKMDIPQSFEVISVEQLVDRDNYTIELIKESEWSNEANIQLVITNYSNKEIEDWNLKFASNFEVLEVWNAELIAQDNNEIVLKNADYTQNILSGQKCIVGMHIKENTEELLLDNCVLTEIKNEDEQKKNKGIIEVDFGVTSVITGINSTCNISAKIIGDSSDEIKVFLKKNNEWTLVGDLYDSGNLNQNNDEIEGDGVYSNILSIDTDTEGIRQYKISLISSGKEIDNVIKDVQIIDVINNEDFEKYCKDINGICENVKKTLGHNEYVYDKTVDELDNTWNIDGINISKIEKVNGSTVKITFNSGLNFYLQFSDKSKMKTMIRGGGDNLTGNTDYVRVAMTKSRNILYWAPFDTVWGMEDETEIVKSIVADSAFSNDLKIINDDKANVNSLKEMNKYGLIILATHGIGGEWIATGEQLGKNSNYLKELSLGQISTYVDYDPSNNEYSLYYMVNDKWFLSNIKDKLPDSIIINNSCESSTTNILWEAFKELGAKTYYGNDGAVTNRYATDRCKYLLNELLVNKTTTEDAYDNTYDAYYGEGAGFTVRGQGNLALSDCLNNANFERNMHSWNSNGDYRVVNRLGRVTPTEGNWMGMISTGIGNNMEGGKIYQTIALPKSAKCLYFDWNFISAEFLEYIDSSYDDSFEIKISCLTSAENEKVIYNRSVNSVAEIFGATSTNAGRLVCASPEISLNGYDDIWMTGWNTDCVNVSDYAGQTIVIEFTVANAEDTQYPTAVLLDNIHFDSEYSSTDDYDEVDKNEKKTLNDMGRSYILYTDEFQTQAESIKSMLMDERAYVNENQVEMNLIKSENDFRETWNYMTPGVGNEEIDDVVIVMHGNYYALIIDDALNENNSEYLQGCTPENLTVSKDHKLTTDANATYIGDLICKNINTLRIYSCNTGLLDAINISIDKDLHMVTDISGTYHIDGNVAQAFLDNNNVRQIIAFDGSVSFDDNGLPRLSYDEQHYLGYLEDLKDKRKLTPYRFEGSMSEFGFEYIVKNKLDSIFKHEVMPNGEVIYNDDNKAIYNYKTNEYEYTAYNVLTFRITKTVEVDLKTNTQTIIE